MSFRVVDEYLGSAIGLFTRLLESLGSALLGSGRGLRDGSMRELARPSVGLVS